MIKEFIELLSYNRNIKKKLIVIRDLERSIKDTEKKKLILAHEVEILKTCKIKEREQIYQNIREIKQKQNKTIIIKGLEIDVVSPSLIEKIKNSFGSSGHYYVEYFGFGNIKKFFAIPDIRKDLITLNHRELYNAVENTTNDEDYFFKGKKIIHIHKDNIFSPKFDDKGKKFIWDISPEYYYNVINNVIDNKLTIPEQQKSNIGELIKKYWWVILAAGGLYYFFGRKKVPEEVTPLFFILGHHIRQWLRK